MHHDDDATDYFRIERISILLIQFIKCFYIELNELYFEFEWMTESVEVEFTCIILSFIISFKFQFYYVILFLGFYLFDFITFSPSHYFSAFFTIYFSS